MIPDKSNLNKGLLENLDDTPGQQAPDPNERPTTTAKPGGRFKNLVKSTVMSKEYKELHSLKTT